MRGFAFFIGLMMALTGLFSMVFSSCTKPEKNSLKEPGELVFYNWKDFTDPHILKDFETETGIRVILKEYETRDMCISQIQTQPQLCDVMIIDTYNYPYLKSQKLVADFDRKQIPNWNRVNDETKQCLNREGIFQPPYLTGSSGLMINTEHVPASTDSWSVLGSDLYKDKIILLDDLREVVVPLVCMTGVSIHETRPDMLTMAHDQALRLKRNGVSFGETFSNIEQVLHGEKWIAQTYSGDFIYKTQQIPPYKFILPKEGYIRWIVVFALHSDAKNPVAAHLFVNFMMRPDIAARSSVTFSYHSPIVGTERYIPQSIADNPVIYPPQETLNWGVLARELGANTNRFQQLFNMMKKK